MIRAKTTLTHYKNSNHLRFSSFTSAFGYLVNDYSDLLYYPPRTPGRFVERHHTDLKVMVLRVVDQMTRKDDWIYWTFKTTAFHVCEENLRLALCPLTWTGNVDALETVTSHTFLKKVMDRIPLGSLPLHAMARQGSTDLRTLHDSLNSAELIALHGRPS